LRERERKRVGGGAEGKRILSRLHAQHTGFELMTRAEIKSWTLNQLRHPGAPRRKLFNSSTECKLPFLVIRSSMNFSCRPFPGDTALYVEQDFEETFVTTGNCYLLVLSKKFP